MALRQNSSGQNSLALAAGSNCDLICRHLAGLIDVTHPDAERHAGALGAAFGRGNYDILKWLVMEANADVNFPCHRRYKTLTTAQLAASRSPDLLQWMVDHGAVDLERENDVSPYFGNVLIAAMGYSGSVWYSTMGYGNIESVRTLLKAGANANAAVKNGMYGSPLVAAVEKVSMEDHVETVKMLLDSGADPNLHLISGMYGSALEALVSKRLRSKNSEEHLREMQYMLLEAGADPAVLSDRGGHGSALAAAAFYGRKDLLKVMIDRVGTERAINTLRQSRHPDKREFDERNFNGRDRKRQKDTAIYLAREVGVNKDILNTIGLEYEEEMEI